MSSSIFSSEHIRAYRTLPGSERRWHVQVAVVLVLTFIVAQGVARYVDGLALRHGNSAYLTLANDSLSAETDVVFIGSSQTLSCIRPDGISESAMNIAGPGFSYEVMERVVDRHLPRMPNLALAVVELDAFGLVFDADIGVDSTRLRAWGFRREELAFGDPNVIERGLDQLRVLTIPGIRLTPFTLSEWIKDRDRSLEHVDAPVPGYRVLTDVLAGERAVVRRLTWMRDHCTDAAQLRNHDALLRMVDALVQRGVRVAFYEPPHADAYAARFPAEWSTPFEETKRQLLAAHPESPVWSYAGSDAFETSDFTDGAHTNRVGAAKLTGMVAERVRQELRREDG